MRRKTTRYRLGVPARFLTTLDNCKQLIAESLRPKVP